MLPVCIAFVVQLWYCDIVDVVIFIQDQSIWIDSFESLNDNIVFICKK